MEGALAAAGSPAGGTGWNGLVKRGLHTLRKPQYEAVWVSPADGVAPRGSAEWERLKGLDQLHVFSGCPVPR